MLRAENKKEHDYLKGVADELAEIDIKIQKWVETCQYMNDEPVIDDKVVPLLHKRQILYRVLASRYVETPNIE